jgi:hypothetical protein
MNVRPTVVGAGTALVAVALTASACTSSGSAAQKSPAGKAHSMSSPSMTMPATSSSGAATGRNATTAAASSLRAGLTELLRKHVDLTGFAVQSAVINGISSSNTSQALKALDANTVALGKAIGSIYGASADKQFVKLWRAHIGYFVTYTKGLATKNQAMVNKAQTQLAGYRQDFSKFVSSATGLPAAAVSKDLQGHVETLEAAIQAIVSKSPSAGAKLEMAAAHLDGTAAVLAKGIATQQKLAGNVDGSAATLRAGLTGLLIQHVAQTTQTVQTAVETTLTSAQTAASVKALDQNTVDLARAIGSIYGADARAAFLKMWRQHIGFFVSYTKGLATHDQKLVGTAQHQLAGYRADFAKFLGSATGLPAAAVAADLQGHITTLEAAIRAIVTKNPQAGAKVSIAESHMAGTAAVLAQGIAAQKHLS